MTTKELHRMENEICSYRYPFRHESRMSKEFKHFQFAYMENVISTSNRGETQLTCSDQFEMSPQFENKRRLFSNRANASYFSSISLTTEGPPPLSSSLDAIYPVFCFLYLYIVITLVLDELVL